MLCFVVVKVVVVVGEDVNFEIGGELGFATEKADVVLGVVEFAFEFVVFIGV